MALLAFLLLTLAQDDAKKAQEILDAAAAKLKDAPALQVDYVWNVHTAKGDDKIRISLLAKRPNLARYTEKQKGVNSELTLFDGTWFWTYDTDRNSYSKSAQSPYLFSTYVSIDPLRQLYFKGASRLLYRASEVKVGEEKLKNETCRTIAWTRQRGKSKTDTQKLWIDSKDVIRRFDSKSKSGEEESEESVAYRSVNLNPTLAEDAFTFKPKAGAKETESTDDLLPVGSQAPEIEATDLDGKKVTLADYKGKTVLLNFWFHG